MFYLLDLGYFHTQSGVLQSTCEKKLVIV